MLDFEQPFLCKFPLISQHFLMLVLGCTVFLPIYTEMENWDFQCCSRLDFSIFPMMKEIKNWTFLDQALSLIRDSLVDQSMLFTHF